MKPVTLFLFASALHVSGLWLAGLTTIDVDIAQRLTTFAGKWLDLDGVTRLDADTAQALATFRGSDLHLNGLNVLDRDTAEALAAFAGGLLLLDGRLALPNLKKISSKTLTALVAKKDVEIPFIETLKLISEPDGSATEDFIIPGWLADREDRQRLGFAK